MKLIALRTLLRSVVSNAWLLAAAILTSALGAEPAGTAPDPISGQFSILPAPPAGRLLLRRGDRLAICGDSITEQKMYSRLIETYLTVCVPELEITARQYGWSGETAEGFLHRMTNDCLRFDPTVATTCYGMNDYKYRPYDAANARWYEDNYTAIVHAFQWRGARVVLGSPGCVGKVASWVKSASGTLEEHNFHLAALRNRDIGIAAREHVRFADVFGPMFTAAAEARQRYGTNYAVAGKDGVHPGWAGQLIMSYAFLKAMGLSGDIGTFTVDLRTRHAKASAGHKLEGFADNELTITSRRYPFCATGPVDKDDSIRSGMTLVPFNQDLNRLMLVVKHGSARHYKITWGETSRVYTAERLAGGVNLAEDFPVNPFSVPFHAVEAAVLAKQAYETHQIKEVFHQPDARANMAATELATEAERHPLALAIRRALVPVTHTLRIEPE